MTICGILRSPSPAAARPSLALVLLALLLGTLWLAGGASRADMPGQPVVRAAAWSALVLLLLFGRHPAPLPRPVLLLMAGAIALPLLQLVPLPPAIWQALPGRTLLSDAVAATGRAQPWRPLSIDPDATFEAASSLIVPCATLMLVTGLREDERHRLPGMLLALAALSSLVGLWQCSGAPFDTGFVNGTAGEISGTFANRNHFALFLAQGCLIAPPWAFRGRQGRGWRAPVAAGLLLLFALTILASGSRAGILCGLLGSGIGIGLAGPDIRHRFGRQPRWRRRLLLAGGAAAMAGLPLLSLAAGRAVSIDRFLLTDPGADMRIRALPTLLVMMRDHAIVGSGLGTFETLFRIYEPFDLLKPTYFNHAHDEGIELLLDAGLPGLLLLLAALGWWLRASVRAWWIVPDRHPAAARLGGAMLLLILVASAVDYPARTPMIMALIVIAGALLADQNPTGPAPLPRSPQDL